MNEDQFIQNLAVLTALGGIVAVIFAKFKWPKVLGYIGVGVLMNKYTWGGSFLEGGEMLPVIGQMGVIYLMLMMGLTFSTSQVKRMKTVIVPVALIDTVVMTWLGYTVGTRFLGWDMVPSLFLGVAICDSATTMLAKVIDELKWGNKPFVRFALGTSVCEDIFCVGSLAVISGVAKGQGISLLAAGTSLGGLFVFFLSVFVFGMILIPRLLASVEKTHDDEALLLAFVGCCCFVAWMALELNFSVALGAFLVGVIGSSSDVRKKLNGLLAPLVSMNAAVFFMSIGLLVDPAACFRHLPTIIVLSAVVVVGKFVNCSLGALLAGQGVKTAIQMGMSLAQIGEFAFMVAILYVGMTDDKTCPMFEIVIAVSVLTTLLNPMLIRYSEPVGAWVERHLPVRAAGRIETYRGFVAKLQFSDHKLEVHRIVRTAAIQLGVVGVLNFAVAVAFTLLEQWDFSEFSVFCNAHKRFIFCLLVNLFIVAMLVPVIRIGRTLGQAFSLIIVGAGETKWHTAMRNAISLAVVVGVVVLLFCEMSMINVNLAPEEVWERWTIRGILLLAAIFGWRVFIKAVDRASTRFTEALGAEERRAKMEQMMTFTIPEEQVTRLQIAPDSPAVESTVISLNIRAKTGSTVVSVEREGVIVRNIGPDLEFRSGDVLVVMGSGSQIAALKDLLGIVS